MFNHGVRGRRGGDNSGITGLSTAYVEARSPQVIINGYFVSGTDDLGIDVNGGQTIIVTGGGFASGITGTIGGVSIGSITYISPTQISFTAPAKSGGLYVLVLTNSNGNTGALVPGVVYSSVPTFSTAAGSIGTVYETASYSKTISATSDSTITYSISSGSIPPDATFNTSTGIMTGTVPAIASGSTTYSFSVTATDSELQDVTRSFTITQSTDVLNWITPANAATINLDGSPYSQALSATAGSGSGVTYSANALPTGLTLSSGTISGTPTVEGTVSTLLTATATTTTRTGTNTITWVVSLADANWKHTTLLLSASASAQTSSFIADNSNNNHQLAIVADTKANNFNPYQIGYYTNYFNGATSDYLTVTGSGSFSISTGDFTIEAWVYLTSLAGSAAVVSKDWTSGSTYPTFAYYTQGSTGKMCLTIGSGTGSSSGAQDFLSTNPLTLNTWNHVAVVKAGSNVTHYLNGVANGVTAQTGTIGGSTGTVKIAAADNGSYWYGMISNLRIVRQAMYISAFTPSTTPLAPIVNTVLLSCQSNRFEDRSINNYTVTLAGSTKLLAGGPFATQYVLGTQYYSTSFNGSTDYIAPVSVPAPGTASFTVEMWVWFGGADGTRYDLFAFGGSAVLYKTTSNTLNWYMGADRITATFTVALYGSRWTHIAISRDSSNNTRMFINGTQAGSTYASDTNNYTVSGVTIGWNSGGGYWLGNISNFRLVNGTALYIAPFTPSTTPLTAIANTVLLTCQDSTFKDNSTNNLTITAGTTTVKPVAISPFTPSYYSNYFSGSNDYLSIANNAALQLGSNSFTIECWIWTTSLAATSQVFSFNMDSGASGFAGARIQINTNGTLNLLMAANTSAWTISSTSTNAITTNAWYHLALVRNGTAVTLYVNGNSTGWVTGTFSGSVLAGTLHYIANISYSSGTWFYPGYISNFRLVNGTAIYTANFTPPTSPLTAVANTQLLTCQSLYFIDNSSNAFTITQNSTPKVVSVAPFTQPAIYTGTTFPTTYGSAYFDGTGDYLTIPASPAFTFGTGNFTIEGWVYMTGINATANGIFQQGTSFPINATTNTVAFGTVSAGQVWQIYANGTNTNSTATWSLNTWYHFAVVRNSTTTTLYINGVAVITVTGDSTNYTGTFFGIGAIYSTGYSQQGYISDLRVVKGTAVYTSNFVPQFTSRLTNITNTQLLTLQSRGSHNSNVINDNSGFNNVITRFGDTNNGSYNPFGDTWSNYFNGSSDYFSLPTASATAFGGFNGNYTTIEFWAFQLTSSTTNTSEVIGTLAAVAANGRWYIEIGNGAASAGAPSKIFFQWTTSTSTTDSITTTAVVPVNQWVHIAIVVNATTSAGTHTVNIYVNGTGQSFTSRDFSSQTVTYDRLRIGGNTSSYFGGYLSNLRVVRTTTNVVGYTGSSLTVPTTPLTAVYGTILLTCQSNRLIDLSPVTNTLTATSNITVQKFSPFGTLTAPKYYSTYFNGSTDYLSIPTTGGQLDATGDFTLELWIYWLTMPTTGYQNIAGQGAGGQNSYGLMAGNTASSTWSAPYVFKLNVANVGDQLNGNTTLVAGQWYHLAHSRTSGVNRLFVNGILQTNTYTDSTSRGFAGNPYLIGQSSNCYISNFRYIKGTSLYTTTFTPPTAQLTAVANTQLLTCQDSTFKDNSTNNLVVSGGTTTVKPLAVSPFTPTISNTSISYSPSTFSGSIYFDGSGDYLTLPYASYFDIPANTAFTLDCWVYTSSTNTFIIAGRNWSWGGSGPTWGFTLGSGVTPTWNIAGTGSATYIMATSTLSGALNQWNHYAFTRDTSGVVRIFVNGVIGVSRTDTQAMSATSGAVYLGSPTNNAVYSTGYMSDLRLISGQALYTGNFYPPTSPAQSVQTIGSTNYVSNLLLNNTAGGITDQTRTIDFESFGDVKQTQFSPYNGTYYSNYFNGTTDYLSPPNLAWNPSTNDFCIECWAYFSTVTGDTNYRTIMSNYSGTGFIFSLYNAGTPNIMWFDPGIAVNLTGATTLVAGVWYHVAVTRVSGNIRVFLNGKLDAYATGSTYAFGNFTTQIGRIPTASQTGYMSGYISNLRCTASAIPSSYSTTSTTIGAQIFTPSTSPLTTTSQSISAANVSILTCQSNKFVDNSTNAVTLTPSGSPKVATQNPFQLNTGVSYYFDGTGDYMMAATAANPNFAFTTGDFTIEFWFNASSSSGTQQLYDTRPSGTSGTSQYSALTYVSGSLNYYTAGANPAISGGAVTPGVWNHVALSRSGTSTKLFVNGSQVGSTYTDGQYYLSGLNRPIFGTDGNTPNTANFTGYITEVRVTKGVARYTGTFTPPTGPVKTN